jgi:hypothetical protein
VTLEVGQEFGGLEAVALGADLKGVLEDWEEVDEQACVDQVQKAIFVCGPGEDLLQDRPLGVVVVIHVHFEVRSSSVLKVLQQLDRLYELLSGIVGPEHRCAVSPPVCFLLEQAEQEYETLLRRPEWVTLDVEEEITVGGPRKQRVPVAPEPFGSRGNGSERRRRTGRLRREFLLKPGLHRQLLEAMIFHAFYGIVDLGQRADRGDGSCSEGRPVPLRDVGDERQGVGLPPVARTVWLEVAEVAVIAGLGKRGQRLAGARDLIDQFAADPSPVGGEVLGEKRLTRLRTQLEMH